MAFSKIIKKFITSIFLSGLAIFMVASCSSDNGPTNGIKDAEIIVRDSNKKYIEGIGDVFYITFRNSQLVFRFGDYVQTSDEATYIVSTDVEGKDTIPSKTVLLAEGMNIYHVSVTNEKQKAYATYPICIYRNHMFSVTFDTSGGSYCSPIEIEESYYLDEQTIPTPVKTGYTFVKWNYDFSKPILKDTTITAIWSANKYNCVLDPDGGVVSYTTLSVQYDSTYSLPTPTRLGYSFNGWYDGNTKISNSGTWKFVSNKTFLAHWTIVNYQITYVLNGGTNNGSNPTTYTVNDSFTLLAPTKTGYTFIGWFDANNNQITSVETGTTGSLNLTARWNANKYTITLDPDGGEVSNTTIEVQYDSTYSLPTPTRLGYSFSGWYDGNTNISNSGTWKFASNKTFLAHWTVIYYSISYNLNNGTINGTNPTTYTVNDSFTLLAPTKTGYTFIGWFDANNNQITSVETGTTGSLNLTARWNANKYTITLDPDGGEVSNTTIEVQYDSTYSLPTPTRLGYSFSGWYDGNTNISNSGTWGFVSDKVLTAHWITIHYPITYNLNGGTNNSANPSYYTIENDITFVSPTKTGYTFIGWFDSENNQVTSISIGSTGELALTAHWQADLNQFIVTSSDDSLGTAQVVSGSGYSGEAITVSASLIDDGYFMGWYNNNTFVSGSLDYSFDMPTNDYSLTAMFASVEEWNIAHGITPSIDLTNKHVTYGLYPQTIVSNENLINLLNTEATLSNGWYYYCGEYYAKANANPMTSQMVFSNGASIVSGNLYWFKCEPIQWDILQNSSSNYWLYSSKLLDVHAYGGNYWSVSSLRTWFNNDFYNSAFSLDKSIIQLSNVSNSYLHNPRNQSSNDKFIDTQDYVFALSPYELEKTDYGFVYNHSGYDNTYLESSDTRVCMLTDYAKARGAIASSNKGYYYTRSVGHPVTNDIQRAPWVVTSSGSVQITQNDFYPKNTCVRPSIKIIVN